MPLPIKHLRVALLNLVSSWYREIKHYDCHNLRLFYCNTYFLFKVLSKNFRNVANKKKFEFVDLVVICCRYLRYKVNSRRLRFLSLFNCMQNRKPTIYVSSLKCKKKNFRFEMKNNYVVCWKHLKLKKWSRVTLITSHHIIFLH